MYYVQYFNKRDDKLVEGVGDRSVVILDGREKVENMHLAARRHNGFNRPLYDGYQLMKGERFSTSRPISNLNVRKENGVYEQIPR